MSRETFKSEKVSILALVLPTRCGGVSGLSSMPNLKVTGRTSLLLKLLPGGVQTLNDYNLLQICLVKCLFNRFTQHLFIVSLIPLVFSLFHTCLTPWLHLWPLSICCQLIHVAFFSLQLADQTKVACDLGNFWTSFILPVDFPVNKECQTGGQTTTKIR